MSNKTVILYNSLDIDSKVSKEIIVRQCEQNLNMSSDDIILLDYNDNNYANILDYSDNKIFVCGVYCNSNFIYNLSVSNNDIYIFENNRFKIDAIRDIVIIRSNVFAPLKVTECKCLQVIKSLIDPLGILSSNNVAYKIISDYSNCVCLSNENSEELDRNRYLFENGLNIENLILTLFNIEKLNKEEIFTLSDNDFTEYEQKMTANFKSEIEKYGELWSGNIIVLNARYDLTEELVNDLITVNEKYSMIIVYSKDNSEFVTLKIYKSLKNLDKYVVNIEDIELNQKYWLENGIGVFTKDGKNWKNSNKLSPIETPNILFNNQNAVKFNNMNLYDKFSNKYCCNGNKNRLEVYLTPTDFGKIFTNQTL